MKKTFTIYAKNVSFHFWITVKRMKVQCFSWSMSSAMNGSCTVMSSLASWCTLLLSIGGATFTICWGSSCLDGLGLVEGRSMAGLGLVEGRFLDGLAALGEFSMFRPATASVKEGSCCPGDGGGSCGRANDGWSCNARGVKGALSCCGFIWCWAPCGDCSMAAGGDIGNFCGVFFCGVARFLEGLLVDFSTGKIVNLIFFGACSSNTTNTELFQ